MHTTLPGSNICFRELSSREQLKPTLGAGADPGFFVRGCALVSCSTSTPINHIVSFFCRIPVVLENCRSSQEGGMLTPCTLPLDPPLVFWQLCCQIDIIFTYCKILPNLVSSCWLWWMTCVILANQKWRNNYFEWIIIIIFKEKWINDCP